MSATNSTDEKMLQVQEICQIIKACADAGVTSLKCGPLELSFGKQTEKIPEEKPAVTEITDNERKQIEEDSLTQDEEREFIWGIKQEDPWTYVHGERVRKNDEPTIKNLT